MKNKFGRCQTEEELHANVATGGTLCEPSRKIKTREFKDVNINYLYLHVNVHISSKLLIWDGVRAKLNVFPRRGVTMLILRYHQTQKQDQRFSKYCFHISDPLTRSAADSSDRDIFCSKDPLLICFLGRGFTLDGFEKPNFCFLRIWFELVWDWSTETHQAEATYAGFSLVHLCWHMTNSFYQCLTVMEVEIHHKSCLDIKLSTFITRLFLMQ